MIGLPIRSSAQRFDQSRRKDTERQDKENRKVLVELDGHISLGKLYARSLPIKANMESTLTKKPKAKKEIVVVKLDMNNDC